MKAFKPNQIIVIISLIICWSIKADCAGCIVSPLPGCVVIDTNNTLAVPSTSSCGCLTCNSTFAKNISRCLPCINVTANCQTCTFNSTTPVCVTCISTHALNSVKQCISCSTLINNCTACYYNISIAFCTTCISTHIINTSLNQCLFCNKACANVPLEGCMTVDVNNTLGLCNQTNCSCLTCATYYGMDPNSQCILCNSTIQNCTMCVYVSTNFKCNLCNGSFYLNTTNNSCIRCNTIFYGCYRCSPPNITYCQLCDWGFFMLANTSC